MYFTDPPNREYERLMQQKPRHDKKPRCNKKPIPDIQNKDCAYCLYWNQSKKKCQYTRCVVFGGPSASTEA